MSFYRKHKRVSIDCGDELITKQAHKDECDIHRILKQYQKTGIITHVNNARPLLEELPSDLDFQEAMNISLRAEQAFGSLPSHVRDHFRNDPSRFLAAFSDQGQHDYLRSVGLLKAREAIIDPNPTPAPANDPKPA